jgi:hypothetical protein
MRIGNAGLKNKILADAKFAARKGTVQRDLFG